MRGGLRRGCGRGLGTGGGEGPARAPGGAGFSRGGALGPPSPVEVDLPAAAAPAPFPVPRAGSGSGLRGGPRHCALGAARGLSPGHGRSPPLLGPSWTRWAELGLQSSAECLSQVRCGFLGKGRADPVVEAGFSLAGRWDRVSLEESKGRCGSQFCSVASWRFVGFSAAFLVESEVGEGNGEGLTD